VTDGPADSAVRAAVEAERPATEDLLRELVAAPTLLGHEEAGQVIVRAALRDAGLEPFDVPLDPEALRAHPLGAPFSWDLSETRNVVAVWEPAGAATGRSLLLNAHVDVVPATPDDLWRTAPFTPTEDGTGWLYGRGACDDKAGLAAIVAAVRALRRLGVAPAARLTIQSVVEEEVGGNGALGCAIAGLSAADGAVIVEPTDGAVGTAQVGLVWFDVRVFGVSGHPADRTATVSALDAASSVVSALRRLEEELNVDRRPPFDEHARPAFLNVGVLESGTWPSIVPADCRLRCRLSLLPGQTVDGVRARIETVVAGALAGTPAAAARPPVVRYDGFAAPPWETAPDAPVTAAVTAAAERAGLPRPARVSLLGPTDARTPALAAGTPTVVFGHAGEHLHAPDERVWLPSVTDTACALALLVRDWCGLR
jgi:acetylornithine deacetylase